LIARILIDFLAYTSTTKNIIITDRVLIGTDPSYWNNMRGRFQVERDNVVNDYHTLIYRSHEYNVPALRYMTTHP
jgi:hypothetical protein